MISSIIWPWKNNCFQPGCESSWSLYDSGAPNGSVPDQNGRERPNRVRILSRVHPRGVVGQLQSYFYNVTTSSFTMLAKCDNKSLLLLSNETLVYIPRRLFNSVVNVSGEASLKGIIENPDQSRLMIVNPTCNGDYSIYVANNSQIIGQLHHQENIQTFISTDEFTKKAVAYDIYRKFHATAVEIGDTFSSIYQRSGDKVMYFFLFFNLT